MGKKRIGGVSASEFTATATIWATYTFAPRWYADALEQARLGSVDGKRREIVFAVLFAESYLLEWVRDEVLVRRSPSGRVRGPDFAALSTYFPAGVRQGIRQRWPRVTKALHDSGELARRVDLGGQAWEDFLRLLDFRDGLAHGGVSRPDHGGLPEPERPKPSGGELGAMVPGWPVEVVRRLVLMLHEAAGSEPPDWLESP